MHVIVTTSFQI